MKDQQKPTDEDYRELGRAIEKILRKDHLEIIHSWKSFVWRSVARGLLIGFGSVIGATILIAFFLWLLSQLGEVPLIGDVFEQTKEAIENEEMP